MKIRLIFVVTSLFFLVACSESEEINQTDCKKIALALEKKTSKGLDKHEGEIYVHIYFLLRRADYEDRSYAEYYKECFGTFVKSTNG